MAATTTRYETGTPRTATAAHTGIAVDLPVGGGDNADRVKAAIADSLRAECGREHYVAARRINRAGTTILHWSVSAHCWPTDPAAAPRNKSELAELPGVAGVLRPADDRAARVQADDFQNRIANAAVAATLQARGIQYDPARI